MAHHPCLMVSDVFYSLMHFHIAPIFATHLPTIRLCGEEVFRDRCYYLAKDECIYNRDGQQLVFIIEGFLEHYCFSFI